MEPLSHGFSLCYIISKRFHLYKMRYILLGAAMLRACYVIRCMYTAISIKVVGTEKQKAYRPRPHGNMGFL